MFGRSSRAEAARHPRLDSVGVGHPAARGARTTKKILDVLTNLNRTRVFEFANMHRLPAIYENNIYVRDGGLMSYGPDIDEGLDRVASLVDRILKGVKPADLPFEQPTLFRFAINLKTAKTLQLNVPQLLLPQADEVIE